MLVGQSQYSGRIVVITYHINSLRLSSCVPGSSQVPRIYYSLDVHWMRKGMIEMSEKHWDVFSLFSSNFPKHNGQKSCVLKTLKPMGSFLNHKQLFFLASLCFVLFFFLKNESSRPVIYKVPFDSSILYSVLSWNEDLFLSGCLGATTKIQIHPLHWAWGPWLYHGNLSVIVSCNHSRWGLHWTFPSSICYLWLICSRIRIHLYHSL